MARPARARTTRPPDDPRLLYRIADAARLLGISRSTAYRLIDSGHLTVVQIGTMRRVPRTAIDALIAGGNP